MWMMILNIDQSCLLHKQEQTTKTGPRDRGSRRAVLMTTMSTTKKRQRQIIESTERRDVVVVKLGAYVVSEDTTRGFCV
ncbi:hypothetical protein NC651_015512 [Populus alba x Populus x berolinensis]|nr:hypothetical protein NC651_015512 [Populus alba x Populus x berolinensis]